MTKLLASYLAFALPAIPALAHVEEIVRMDEYVLVQRDDDPVGVIPRRFTDTLFGFEQSPFVLPRSVSVIDEALMQRYHMRTVNDFVVAAPGTHTSNFFGIPGNLEIRGTPGDSYFRGFRRVENRGNFPTAVSASDRIEIVRGPPTPIYGGGKVGGFMNFVPKSARSETAKLIERPAGQATAAYGSYDRKRLDLEYGAPLRAGAVSGGFYAYGQVEDSGSFYENVHLRNRMLQLSLDLDLTPHLRLEAGSMLQHAKLPQNPGWNRATQALIDRGTYVTGHPSTQVPHPVFDGNGNGFIDESEAFKDIHGPPFGFGPPDGIPDPILVQIVLGIQPTPPNPNFALSDPGTTTLSRRRTLVDPLDFANSRALTGYADLIWSGLNGLKLKHQLFYDRLDHQKYSTYGYTADLQPEVFENRLSAVHSWDPPAGVIRAESIAGAGYRRYRTTTREAFGSGMQIPDRRDLSAGPTSLDRFAGAFMPGRSWTREYVSVIRNLGLFTMTQAMAGAATLTVGGRHDSYTVDVRNLQAPEHPRARESVFTGSGSLSYALTPFSGWRLVPYATFGQSTFLELDQGGGIEGGADGVSSGRWLADSDLWEGGVKLTGLEGKLFAAGALYQQNRTRVDVLTDSTVNTRSTGYELEARFAPTSNWAFTFAGTWQKTMETVPADGIGVSVIVPPSLLGQDPAQGFGGMYFTGSTPALGSRSFEAEGQPDKVLSLYGSFTSRPAARTWGATLGTTYVAGVHSGKLLHLKLPSYWLTHGQIHVGWNHWRAAISVRNILDRQFFRSQAIGADTTVLPAEGRTAELSISRRL